MSMPPTPPFELAHRIGKCGEACPLPPPVPVDPTRALNRALDSDNFAQVMQQTLELQNGVVKEISRLHAATTDLSLRGWKLGGTARVLMLAGWLSFRGDNAVGSVVHETVAIDLRDANLNAIEAVELAELMRRQSRLTSLDVRNNDSIGDVGANALAKTIESYKGIVGVTARSICGVSPGSSTLEVPRHLGPIVTRLLCAELGTFVFAAGVGATMGTGSRKDKPAVLHRRGAFAANDWLPLLWAAGENHVELATKMLDLGADINEQQPATQTLHKYSALHAAAQKGNADMVKLLLIRGADTALRDKHGNSALLLAEKKKHTDIISLLAPCENQRGGGSSARPSARHDVLLNA